MCVSISFSFLPLFFVAIHGHHVQNIPNDSMMNQTVAAMQHNSHMVSRGQPSHPVHSVTVNQNPASRLQVRYFHPFASSFFVRSFSYSYIINKTIGNFFVSSQSIAGIPVNSMNQQTNLLANGGTATGNVASYQYSSNPAAISTSQVVIHQQRGISAMQANRFASQGGPTSTYRVCKSDVPRSEPVQRHNSGVPERQRVTV